MSATSREVGKNKLDKERKVALSDAELLDFIDSLKDPRWQLAFGLMSCFGVRPCVVG